MPDTRRPSIYLLCLLLLLAVMPPLASGATLPDGRVEPHPFSARYRLEMHGWPGASVDHRLVREGAQWLSEMRAAIAVASGYERSRFLIEERGVNSLHYASGYSLVGVGGDYRLVSDDMGERADRQASLFELSRRVLSGACSPDDRCRITYLDHRGRPEHLDYRVLGPESVSLPAGDFDAIAVEATEPDHPERRLLFRFHPELPGLLLSVEYHRDGRRRSQLYLTSLSLLD